MIAADQASDESQILQHILRINHIDIPEQSAPLTYTQAAELLRQQLDVVDFALPSTQLLEFMVKSVIANQVYLQQHVPDVFGGDMVMFSAARTENGNGSSHRHSWRPYISGDITAYSVDCTHQEMLAAASLRMYGEQLKAVMEIPAPLDPLVN